MTVQNAIERINDIQSSEYRSDDTIAYQLTSDDFEWLEMAKEALEQQNQKCSFGFGIKILPDSKHELDPCIYNTIEEHKNVTVRVLQCKKCGHIEIEWERQDNTTDEELDVYI